MTSDTITLQVVHLAKTDFLCVSRYALLLATLACSSPAPTKTYTPEELRAMVSAGNYPEQQPPETTEKPMTFEVCVATVEQMTAAITENYPVIRVVNTGVMRTEKLWTNDAAMTVTCSAPDEKLLITTAKYR